jgi:hypothetical protein
MGLRFRKSFTFGPLRINVSKSGIGFSLGVKGFRVGRSAKGKTTATVSLPGTGLSYVQDLDAESIQETVEDIKAVYAAKYNGPVVNYVENADEGGFLEAGKLSGKDGMQVTVCGNEDRILLVAIYDNLGKGASGAALECLNLVLGQEKDFGLEC